MTGMLDRLAFRAYDTMRRRMMRTQAEAADLAVFDRPGPRPSPDDGRRFPVSRPGSQWRNVVVYTAIAGSYDHLISPEVVPQGWDFVCFTDDADVPHSVWRRRAFDYPHPHPARRARYVKLHPHLYFPDAEWTIWVDGNIMIRGDLSPLIGRVATSGDIGMYLHPRHRTISEEALAVLDGSRDDPAVIRRQLERYEEGSHDLAELRVFETGVIVRRGSSHSDLAQAWWRELENGSHRDQISLPIAAAEAGLAIVPLAPSGESARNSSLLTRFPLHPGLQKR